MENKTTTELLDLLFKIERKAEKDTDGKKDWADYEEVLAELRKRPPFDSLIGNRQSEGYEPSLKEAMEDVQDDLKKLKRHKHDEHSGDVLVRI
jgi:hypothetical protein